MQSAQLPQFLGLGASISSLCFCAFSCRNESICAITSIVQPLPSILYCWVLLHPHLYQSGTVCSRAHSVGVSLLMRTSGAFSSAIAYAQPVRLAQHAGALWLMSYTRFCWYGCCPLLLSPLGLSCFVLLLIIKLFSCHALAVSVGALSV